MQLNIETKEEGREQREKLRKRDSFKSLSGCFSILSASYCHLVAKLKMEIAWKANEEVILSIRSKLQSSNSEFKTSITACCLCLS